MKQPLHFILGLLVFISGILLIAAQSSLATGAVVMALGVVVLVHWNTANFRWVCDKCGEEFPITIWQNVTGLNGGINYKYLRCPGCGRRRWCRGR